MRGLHLNHEATLHIYSHGNPLCQAYHKVVQTQHYLFFWYSNNYVPFVENEEAT